MRILYITTNGGTMGFFRSFIQSMLEEGNIIDIAANEIDGKSSVPQCYREWGCKVYHISCVRDPLSKGNVEAIMQIKKIVAEHKYNIVHCHTPIASFCTRLACRGLRRFGVKVIYTAHGFHFYAGAPLKNWFIYYPVEKICSRWTDVVITINKEDYRRALREFYAEKTVYIPGVGVNTKRFGEAHDGYKVRKEFDIPESAILFLTIGELNVNKNQETVIRAFDNLEAYYIIVGQGHNKERLVQTIQELNLVHRVKLAGYRYDVADFYHAADVYILPSLREGLNVSLMEAMASGLPCLVGNIRGNIDLIDDGKGGYLFNPSSIKSIRNSIKKMLVNQREKFSLHNLGKIRKFDVEYVNESVKKIYEREMKL